VSIRAFIGARGGARPHRKLASRLVGHYARALLLPVSVQTQTLRSVSRSLRGIQRGQKTTLPVAPWQHVLRAIPIAVVRPHKSAGGVSLAELAVLSTAAAALDHGTEIIEIGTLDGRTTINFAVNAPERCRIFTLDLPAHTPVKFGHASDERRYVDKLMPGRYFRNAAPEWQSACARIVQLLGDSAAFDWSPHYGRAGLVFVDGSHAYDAVLSDSDTALRLVTSQGIIIWHDYGVWDGVTRALERLEATRHLGLRHVRGTTLVIWRADQNSPTSVSSSSP